MKARNLTYVGGLAALLVAGVMLAQNNDVDVVTNALAETDSGAFSVSCNGGTAPTITAWVPNLDLALTTPSSVGSAPTNSVSVAQSSGTTINSETTSITAITNTTTGGGALFTVSHNAPKMKLTGLQCHDENASSLKAEGTDLSTNYYVYGSDAADEFTTTANQLDTATQITLFGTSGIIEVNAVTDGSGTLTDDSSTANGEVLFGSLAGTDAPLDYLWRLNHKIRFLDVNVADYNTVVENLTFTFTAQ